MRLLETSTRRPCSYICNPPSYAILSHTWTDEEVSFQDMNLGVQATRTKGYTKIIGVCKQAFDDGYTHVWVDTCCIDKQNSSELTEAINSMFYIYRMSKVCYAYLDDVPGDDDPAADGSAFRRSRWFTRGWTLQELLAPRQVVFLAKDWTELGTKASLSRVIEQITRIGQHVLLHNQDEAVSVATRMSWASKRRTTRVEDRAYSLMGLFGVNMQILYGEGPRAFVRLQKEIIKNSTDQSIFAWNGGAEFDSSGLLAPSPDYFDGSENYRHGNTNQSLAGRLGVASPDPAFRLTNAGIRIQLLVKDITESTLLACLACSQRQDDRIVCIYLKHAASHAPGHYTRTTIDGQHIHLATEGKLSNIRVECVVVTEEDSAIYSTGVVSPSDRCRAYKFVVQIPENCDFEATDRAPKKYWREGQQVIMNLTNSGLYGNVVVRSAHSNEAFAVILGVHNWQVWSDICIFSVDGADSSAESVQNRYAYDEGSELGMLRWKGFDWVKKLLVDRKHTVHLSVRERDTLDNVVTYVAKVTISST